MSFEIISEHKLVSLLFKKNWKEAEKIVYNEN